ncbi:MAG TPA: N-acetyltransferase [Caulobacteraceae bacterium]
MRPATAADFAAIRRVEVAAFGREEEAGMVEAARAEGATMAELVEEREGRIVGHILMNRMTVTPQRLIAGLAPVAVDPAFQGRKIGDALCRAGIEAVRAMGAEGVVLLGHPNYYPRFGFSTAATAKIDSPYAGSPAFMALALVPGAFDGPLKVDFPAAFD